MSRTPAAVIAALVVALEGVALLGLAGREIIALASGDTAWVASAVGLLATTIIGAIIVLAFALGIWHDESWGRSGGIVVQLLIFAVAIGLTNGAYANLTTALLIAAPGIVGFVALVIASRQAGARRERERQEAEQADAEGTASDTD